MSMSPNVDAGPGRRPDHRPVVHHLRRRRGLDEAPRHRRPRPEVQVVRPLRQLARTRRAPGRRRRTSRSARRSSGSPDAPREDGRERRVQRLDPGGERHRHHHVVPPDRVHHPHVLLDHVPDLQRERRRPRPPGSCSGGPEARRPATPAPPRTRSPPAPASAVRLRDAPGHRHRGGRVLPDVLQHRLPREVEVWRPPVSPPGPTRSWHPSVTVTIPFPSAAASWLRQREQRGGVGVRLAPAVSSPSRTSASSTGVDLRLLRAGPLSAASTVARSRASLG